LLDQGQRALLSVEAPDLDLPQTTSGLGRDHGAFGHVVIHRKDGVQFLVNLQEAVHDLDRLVLVPGRILCANDLDVGIQLAHRVAEAFFAFDAGLCSGGRLENGDVAFAVE